MKISTLLINSARPQVLFLAVLCCLAMKPGTAFSQTINTGAVGPSLCSGASVSVPYTSSGITFNSGNTFTAQLSDKFGSFTTPTTIGTLANSTATSGTVTATIPVTTTGSGYRIRIKSSAPVATTLNANSNGILTINQGPGVVTITPLSPITNCYGSLNSLTATSQSQSAGATPIDLHGTFEGSQATVDANWTRANTSTNNQTASQWTLRSSPYTYSAQHIFFFFFQYRNDYTFNSNNNTQFYLSNSSDQRSGTTNTTLTTQTLNAISTLNLTSLTLNFYQNLRVNTGDLARVQVSTTGAAGPWTTVQTFNSQQGSETLTSFSGTIFNAVIKYDEKMQQASVNLTPYINTSTNTMLVRFAYTATSGFNAFPFARDNWWAIDNVTATGSGAVIQSPVYTWAPQDGNIYTDALYTTTYGGENLATVYAQIVQTNPIIPQTYTATAKIGGCSSTSSPVSLYVSSNYTWTGIYGTDWGDYRNWCSGNVPDGSQDVTIPSGTPNLPVLVANDAIVQNINIAGGANVNVNGHTFVVTGGAMSGLGTLTGSHTSAVSITGGSTGTVYFTPNDFTDVNGTTNNYLKTFNVVNSNITVGDSLNITGGTAPNTFGTLNVVGATSKLTTSDQLTLKSNVYGDARVGQSSGTISGNVVVERYVPYVRAWRFLSVPVNTTPLTIRGAWMEGATPNPTTAPANDPKPGFGTEITYLQNSTANGYDQNITNNPSIKVWDVPSQVWSSLPSINIPITNYPAYCLFVRGNRLVNLANGVSVAPANAQTTVLRNTGTLNTGTVTQDFGNVTNGYWILAKNPYASPINMQNGVTYNNIANTYFQVWDPKLGGTNGVGAYVSWSTTTGWSNTGGSYNNSSLGIIQSGQAFFVQASTASNPKSIVITETSKSLVEYSTSGFSSPESPVTQENSKPAVENSTSNVSSANSSVTQENSKPVVGYSTSGVSSPKSPVLYAQLILPTDSMKVSDGVAVTFGKRFSAAKDSFDVPKRWNEQGENMALVRDSNTFAIECRPVPVLNDTLFFRLYLRQQPYALRLFSQDLPENLPGKAWLVDKYLNTQTEVNLYDTTVYNFTPNTDTNSYRNRFMLVFNRKPVTKADNPGTTGNANSIVVYPNPIIPGGKAMLKLNDLPKGKYEITVINSAGNILKKKTFVHAGGSSTYDIQTGSRWVAGNYVLKITGEDGYSFSTNLVVGK